MTDQPGLVLLEHPRPGIAQITLNRPERMNAMSFELMVPLREAFESVTHDNSVRVVVLTGAGRAFCAGADQKGFGQPPHTEGLPRPTYWLRFLEFFTDTIVAVRRLHQPVIAAVNGVAIGGGMGLALAADIRIASPAASFRAGAINIGNPASEIGLSFLLPRVVGAGRASEIMLTGRDVGAEEAERIGLVSAQVPPEQLLDTAYAMAERIAGFSRTGVELTKRTLWDSLEASALDGHMQTETLSQLYLQLNTANQAEAGAARAEKRPPVFSDEL